jgi:formylmethanofuran dehydrogenase subunit E
MLALALSLLLTSSDAGTPSRAVEETRFVHGSPAHGVPGPWALVGHRIGAHALRKLGRTREGAFSLEVVHRSPAEVRYTCLADGLMASTGVSPGKLNLKLESAPSEAEMETVVKDRKAKKQLIYRLLPSFRDRARPVDFADFPAAAKWLEAMGDAELFTVEERALP